MNNALINLNASLTEADAQPTKDSLTDLVAPPVDALLHELQIHQVELEMQNEALRQSHLALEASRARYLNLYELAPVAYLTLTHEGLIHEINLTGAALLGIERRELIDCHFSAIVAPKDTDRWYLLFKKLMRHEEEKHAVELLLRRSNNADFHALLNCQRVTTEVNALAMHISLTDITKYKHAEEALRKSQRDLNHAQAVAHIGSWRIDLSNNKLEWSDETFRIFGIAKGAPLTYPLFLDCVHPADRQLVDAAWKFALTGKPYDIEHRIIVDQKIKWVREQAEIEFDDDGSLLSGFGTTEDITEIKSSQEALQHERAFLRQVIDAVPNVIFVKDREGRFLLGNEALAQSYGTSTEGLIGLTEESFNANVDEVTRFYQNDLLVINSCMPQFIPDEKVTHADGSVHWYNTVKIPLIDNNKCNKVLVVATDMTDSKRTAEALRLANQRKDEFLAMLAHELRNPLAPIRNTVQLLNRQKITDPTLAKACHVIDRQVTHMVRLLDDLLDVARYIQGKIRLQVEHLELTDIINNAVETSYPLIESRGQALIIAQAATPQWIQGDRVRLAQVLSNLLNNAAKYTNEGGKITLSVTQEGSDVVIDIRDTGVGIAPEILPQIFDLFTQADHSLAHSQGGLGIGLTLVRQLVEKHGGTVTAASAGIGHGSTFSVRLPAVSKASSGVEVEITESVLLTPRYRILVVDDYDDAAESLMMVLEAEGHQVEIANFGIKAIEQAPAFHPQVVLLDIGLPDLNGYEVAKKLRTLPETQNAILIALTGYGQPADLELAQSAGFNHYLLKPVDFERLFTLLASSPEEHSDKD
ncbi:PAS domain S-box protein [Methylobacter sp. G7]|uniref:hybrid sensor histidine kinase/response regulator n=1 Tax=Methylobacter sp. G7 TaxID=3230117 RepID=UPI003D805C07